jgi:two-component system, chemotaxis family, chemotaxis protein CheY
MPDGEEEGIQVLEKLIKINKKALIIMITALGQDTIKEKCMKLGARDYITKPFSEEDVLKKVSKYLK